MGESGELERSEVEALLAARRELGREYDGAFVEAFADRIERAVAERTSAVAVHQAGSEDSGSRQFILGIVSLGAGIPISAISAGISDLPGLMVAWAGIVGVNVAHSLTSRPRRR